MATGGSARSEGSARPATWTTDGSREDEDIVLVSAADKLHNARAILSDYRRIGEKLWARFNTGRDGTLWYYRGLCEVIDVRLEGSAPQLAAELHATLDALTDAIRALSAKGGTT